MQRGSSVPAVQVDVSDLTAVVTSITPTVVILSNDFTTSSATAVDVTGLSFAPTANKHYVFDGMFEIRTTNAAVSPRIGLAWATGLVAGVATIRQTGTLTAEVVANGAITGAILIAAGTVPLANTSYPAFITGFLLAGGSPGGALSVQLASSLAGTSVTLKAGSFLRYWSY